MKNMKFPFSDAPNTACFTCCHVLAENSKDKVKAKSHLLNYKCIFRYVTI